MSQAFNKNQPKASQKKQMVVLAVLGVVLLGLVAHYGMNQTPQSASADSGNSGTDTPALVPDKQPSDAITELALDPTRDLLRGNRDVGTEFDQAPTNPFAMDAKWQAGLTKPVVNLTTTHNTQEPVFMPVAPHVAATVNLDAIRLQAIILEGKHKYAIVNGTTISVGAVVHGARVVEILDDRMLVVPDSDPDTTPVEIFAKKHFQ